MNGLLRRWTGWVAAGELAGFVVPTVVGALVLVEPRAWSYPAMIGAGVLEGVVLGAAQAHVLRGVLPAVSVRRWIGATAIGAALGWVIGLLPSMTSEVWPGWPGPVLVLTGLVGAVALVCSIGALQWLELRRHVARAGWWVVANAAAWGFGLIAMLAVSTPLWQPGQSIGLVVAIGVLAGAVMAATMALTTGLALRRLLDPDGRHASTSSHRAPLKPAWRHAS